MKKFLHIKQFFGRQYAAKARKTVALVGLLCVLLPSSLLAQPGEWSLTATNRTHRFTLLPDAELFLGDQPVDHPVWLGAFRKDSNNRLRPAGALLWNPDTSAPQKMLVFGAENQSPGMHQNEKIFWVLFDPQTNCHWFAQRAKYRDPSQSSEATSDSLFEEGGESLLLQVFFERPSFSYEHGPVACTGSKRRFMRLRNPVFAFGDLQLEVLQGAGSLAIDSQTGTIDLWNSERGFYTILVRDSNFCTEWDTLSLQLIQGASPQFVWPNRQDLCPLNGDTLKGPKGFAQYRWWNGDTTANTVLRDTGLIWLEVTTQQGCSYRDSIRVSPLFPKSPPFYDTARNHFCKSEGLLPLIADTAFVEATRFSASDPGLAIDTLSGVIDLAESDTGAYSVFFHTPFCLLRRKLSLHVHNNFKAGYPDSVFCATQDSINFQSVFPLKEAEFAAEPAGLSLDPTTGTIRPSASEPGRYTVSLNTAHCPGQNRFTIRVVGRLAAPGLPQDTTFCPTERLILQGPEGMADYRWSPGNGESRELEVPAPGNFELLVSTPEGCQYRYTTEVLPAPRPRLPQDTTLCRGGKVRVELSAAGLTAVTWPDSSHGSSFEPQSSGPVNLRYTTSGGCQQSHQFQVEVLPAEQVTLESEQTGCREARVEVKENLSAYHWPDGSTAPTYLADESGTVEFWGRKPGGCIVEGSLTVDFPRLELATANLVQQKANCEQGGKLGFELDSSNNPGGTPPYEFTLEGLDNPYNRSDFATQFSDLPKGNYRLVVRDAFNCTDTLKQRIRIERQGICDHPVFTPNGDGQDDFYYIPFEGTVQIFNRYGQELRRVEGPYEWPGTDGNGQKLPMGTYIIRGEHGEQVRVTIVK